MCMVRGEKGFSVRVSKGYVERLTDSRLGGRKRQQRFNGWRGMKSKMNRLDPFQDVAKSAQASVLDVLDLTFLLVLSLMPSRIERW